VTPQPPDALPTPSGTLDERSTLEGFLEQYRAVVVRKANGLTDAQAREVLVPSGTSVAGLLRHLRWVEDAWFGEVLAGGVRPSWRDEDPQRQFAAGSDSLTHLIDAYTEACERSRAIAAEHGLDDTGVHPRLGTVSLRWIYVHLIEELARHAGHLDILREQLDGATGFD
jgi:Protein of unknown function (DUF664)